VFAGRTVADDRRSRGDAEYYGGPAMVSAASLSKDDLASLDKARFRRGWA
jgi:hypothetical protein